MKENSHPLADFSPPSWTSWGRPFFFVGIHLACLAALHVGVSAMAAGVALALYMVRMFAITAIYHRYFSHDAFKMKRGWQFVFAFIGCTAAQRGPLWWVAHHRQHHANADCVGDPHSPRHGGFWHSHMGWFMCPERFPVSPDNVRALAKYPELRLLDRFDVLPPALLIALLWLLGWCLERAAPGLGTNGLQMVVWGFCISTTALYHATFLINSGAHRSGSRRYATRDDSRNNLFLALLTFGEGWHNNHHHFPGSAKQGFFWWEIDLTYYLLRVLQSLGIVSDLKLVPHEMLAARRTIQAPLTETLQRTERAPKALTGSPVTAEPHHMPPSRAIDRLARWLIFNGLSRLKSGVLSILDDGSKHVFGNRMSACDCAATVQVNNPRFYTAMALGGSIGAGEAFMRGDWQSDDMPTVMRILLRNRHVLDDMEAGWVRLAAPGRRALHWMAINTRNGSSRNIAAHYDLGNDYFKQVLGPEMMYSCVRFEHPGASLADAEQENLQVICRKLALAPDDHVIEVGGGWGGFALYATRHHGCRVTVTTISREQHRLMSERVEAAGLSDRITVLLEDYRQLAGEYTKLVSIEMVEHVGHRYYEQYFSCCAALLGPGGRMYLQASTIREDRYRAALRSMDFIQRHIFPGACIPAVSVLCESAGHCGLQLVGLEDTGEHYVETLRAWRRNLLANAPAIRAMGYSEVLVRAWTFYLSYCESGFAERALGATQMVFVKTATD